MTTPAKPASPKGEGAAGPSLADAVVGAALQTQQAPKEDPASRWAEMGGELYDALEKKDRASFSSLFTKQVKLAVKEALRGNK